jgi:hypothetical protein
MIYDTGSAKRFADFRIIVEDQDSGLVSALSPARAHSAIDPTLDIDSRLACFSSGESIRPWW